MSCRISSRKCCPASSAWVCGSSHDSVESSIVCGWPLPVSKGAPCAEERHNHALTWLEGSSRLLCRVPSSVWRTPMSSSIPVAYAAAPSPLPQRPLGQTGAAVPLFGLGGEGVLRTYDRAAEAVRVIHRALEHGVNYCDTAPAYAGSLDYYGAALGERRAEIFLASKTHDRTRDGSLRLLEQSLRRVRTTHLD